MQSECPNLFPRRDAAYRLAFVGEAPGTAEVTYRQPFAGASGALLNRITAALGLARETLFLGNVAQVEPGANDFSRFAWDGPEVQGGISQLLADLAVYSPNLVVCLGNVALHLFRAGNVAPATRKKGAATVNVYPFSITRWRGTLFAASPLAWAEAGGGGGGNIISQPGGALPPGLETGNRGVPDKCGAPYPSRTGTNDASEITHPTHGSFYREAAPCALPSFSGPGGGGVAQVWKCLATLHPACVLRNWGEMFNLRQDLKRAKAEAGSAALVLPEFRFAYGPV